MIGMSLPEPGCQKCVLIKTAAVCHCMLICSVAVFSVLHVDSEFPTCIKINGSCALELRQLSLMTTCVRLCGLLFACFGLHTPTTLQMLSEDRCADRDAPERNSRSSWRRRARATSSLTLPLRTPGSLPSVARSFKILRYERGSESNASGLQS